MLHLLIEAADQELKRSVTPSLPPATSACSPHPLSTTTQAMASNAGSGSMRLADLLCGDEEDAEDAEAAGARSDTLYNAPSSSPHKDLCNSYIAPAVQSGYAGLAQAVGGYNHQTQLSAATEPSLYGTPAPAQAYSHTDAQFRSGGVRDIVSAAAGETRHQPHLHSSTINSQDQPNYNQAALTTPPITPLSSNQINEAPGSSRTIQHLPRAQHVELPSPPLQSMRPSLPPNYQPYPDHHHHHHNANYQVRQMPQYQYTQYPTPIGHQYPPIHHHQPHAPHSYAPYQIPRNIINNPHQHHQPPPSSDSRLTTMPSPPTPSSNSPTLSGPHQGTKLHERQVPHPGKVFTCVEEGCGKIFYRKHHLVSHLVSHTTEKPFSCPKCGSLFRRSADLRRHLRNVRHNE
ncbi:homeodomain transcription factor ste12 [Rhizoclosmatium sp. JEL0117]|nr:homeodomain transcription factor ste12 [Rhizoclosmatium sp. JEL0117]